MMHRYTTRFCVVYLWMMGEVLGTAGHLRAAPRRKEVNLASDLLSITPAIGILVATILAL